MSKFLKLSSCCTIIIKAINDAKLVKSFGQAFTKACGFHKAEPLVAHRSERNTP